MENIQDLTVLVTGGMGYIGSHTCVELLEQGAKVIIVDNLCNSNAEVMNRIEKITGKRPLFYQIDVRDEKALSRVFDENKVDAVIHFAGLKAVGESVEKPMLYYENNVKATMVLCNIMQRYRVEKIIFSSSATVYSQDNQMPLSEESRTGNCTSPYGWTKYFCEKILTDISKAEKSWSVVLLRYFNPIGAHPSGIIGEDPKGIPNNLMPFIAQTAVGIREKLFIFGDDYNPLDGTGIRDYIHVVDLAKGHIAAIDWLYKHQGTEVFNLGTGQGYSVLQIVETFQKVNGVEIPYEIIDRRPGDVALCYADASKSECLLGWKTERTLEDMCRDTWNWQKNNPNGYNE